MVRDAPVGELTPLRPSRFVRAEAVVAISRNAPGVGFALLRADLDALAGQDAAPRR